MGSSCSKKSGSAPEELAVDSGTFTWAGRNPGLLPALHWMIPPRNGCALLVLGAGCIRPLGAVPELIEIRSMLKETSVRITVVDHNPEVLESVTNTRYYWPQGASVPTESTTQQLTQRLAQSAASIQEDGPAPSKQELTELVLDIVNQACPEYDGGRELRWLMQPASTPKLTVNGAGVGQGTTASCLYLRILKIYY